MKPPASLPALHLDRRSFCAALAVAMVPLGAAWSQERIVEGSAAYRERIALPPEAALTVRLGVMAGGELGEPLLAEQILSPAGQVPIGFSLRFDPAAVPADAALGLEAIISVDGNRWFETAGAVPLPAEGPAELMLVRAAPQAPAPSGPDLAAAITGVEWTVLSIDGIDALGETAPTLTIAEDGSAGGHSGCNRFIGRAALDGETLGFTGIASTLMACDDAAMRVERAYYDALAATATFTLSGGILALVDADGRARVRLGAGA